MIAKSIKNSSNKIKLWRVEKVDKYKNSFKQIVEENKADIHSFVEHPDAEEYYDTLKIEEQLNAK